MTPFAQAVQDKTMNNVEKVLQNVGCSLLKKKQKHPVLRFDDFLKKLQEEPHVIMRNIFQVFHDMIMTYAKEGKDEYPNDPESINYVSYDCSRLFVEGSELPFFADRLFANRLISFVKAFKSSAQQNKIYIFEGPHGCGKSTFLNNLLNKFEEYSNGSQGMRYEALWRLDSKTLLGIREDHLSIFEKIIGLEENRTLRQLEETPHRLLESPIEEYVEVPCPSHDHPILMIPKEHRRAFLDDLFENDEFKYKLFTEKEYEWVFTDVSCTICSSIFQSLMNKLKNPMDVFRMLHAKPYEVNRRLGEGISVFNPGDEPMMNRVTANHMLQNRINAILKDSNKVWYMHSPYAKTNNGIYGIMDIKSHNTDRLIKLHNIISEGVHKVEYMEENVNSLFMALMNPEDKKNIQNIPSFSDRIEYIKIPYVLDFYTETEIYRNIFGKHIDSAFLPMVLENFARVIISSRLVLRSRAMWEWIGNPEKYRLVCDENLQLLKMEIYAGHIPPWLNEDDRKRFTAKRRRHIIAESEFEGAQGFSGRDSITIFGQFFAAYAKNQEPVDMASLYNFFTRYRKDLGDSVPRGFMDALIRLYDYTVLQQLKESLYYYNEAQIVRDIQNYIFAVNFEPGVIEVCRYTGDRLHINEEYFRSMETYYLGAGVGYGARLAFRKEIQKKYATKTLTQEILMEGRPLTHTELFEDLHERYVRNLKEKVLEPFQENENFRRAIKDWGTDNFRTYDNRIRNDVDFLINNLCRKFRYSRKGAKAICMYVMDRNLANTYADF